MLYNGKYIHLFYLRFKAYLLSNLFLIVCFFLVSIYTNAFANYFVQDSISCLDLQIEVLQEPFCQGSVNGGQLKVNVTSGSGSYSYEWLNDNGGTKKQLVMSNPDTTLIDKITSEQYPYFHKFRIRKSVSKPSRFPLR